MKEQYYHKLSNAVEPSLVLQSIYETNLALAGVGQLLSRHLL